MVFCWLAPQRNSLVELLAGWDHPHSLLSPRRLTDSASPLLEPHNYSPAPHRHTPGTDTRPHTLSVSTDNSHMLSRSVCAR